MDRQEFSRCYEKAKNIMRKRNAFYTTATSPDCIINDDFFMLN